MSCAGGRPAGRPGSACSRFLPSRLIHVANSTEASMIKRNSQRNGVTDMVTVKAAAERIGVSPRRMHQLVKSRRLTTTRVEMGRGCVFLLDPAEIAALAKEDRRPGRPTSKKTRKSR